MKISELIKKLQDVQIGFGDIDVEYHEASEDIIVHEINYVVPESYEESGQEIHICNIRAWHH